MSDTQRPLIAIVGATGHQGGSVLRALQRSGRFRTRALTRNPAKHAGLADEVVMADLDRPETLEAAMAGAHGLFMVTNFWEDGGADEITQGTAAVRAAKAAGVDHFIWSTLPDVEAISGGRFDVAHFTDKSRVDAVVAGAGFPHHSFVILPFLYQNLLTVMAPQPRPDGAMGWTLPIDPAARVIHAGDLDEFGPLVAGAFAAPELAGNGAYLPLVGEKLSFGGMVDTLNRQGHAYRFQQVPAETFAGFFPGAAEIAAMLGYFEAHSYLGGDAERAVALARQIAGRSPTDFSTWAEANMPAANGTGAVEETSREPADVR